MEPEPEVPGGAEVTFKHGEPTKIELTVKHLVDGAPWNQTDFVFDIDGGVASIRGIEPESDTLWIEQNREAREKAYETVREISIVDSVERIHD